MKKHTYRQNNLIFRIASADAISKFKSTQAHSFLQLSRREINFDKAIKEALLASYDRFSYWILEAEQHFLDAPQDEMLGERFAQAEGGNFAIELQAIQLLFYTHEGVFLKDASEYLSHIFVYSAPVFMKRVMQIAYMTPASGFTFFVEEISNFLQHILLTLHEYDNNIIKKENPFLNVSCFDTLAYSFDIFSVETRARFFIDHNIDIGCFVKNYAAGCEVCDGVCSELVEPLVDKLQNTFNIKCKLELVTA